MYEEQTTEVTPESSPGIAPSTDPSSAGTQNTEQFQGQVQDARGNTIPSWRVQEIRQQAEAQAYARAMADREQWQHEQRAQMQQEADAREQRLIQALQQRAQRPSRTAEEEQQRRQAQEVLHELAPGLKVVPLMGKSLVELNQRVEALTAQQAESQQR